MKTLVYLFNETMSIQGINYDNVLLFLNDAAHCMLEAGQALSVKIKL